MVWYGYTSTAGTLAWGKASWVSLRNRSFRGRPRLPMMTLPAVCEPHHGAQPLIVHGFHVRLGPSGGLSFPMSLEAVESCVQSLFRSRESYQMDGTKERLEVGHRGTVRPLREMPS